MQAEQAELHKAATRIQVMTAEAGRVGKIPQLQAATRIQVMDTGDQDTGDGGSLPLPRRTRIQATATGYRPWIQVMTAEALITVKAARTTDRRRH